MIYFFKGNCGFYSEDIHGPRKLTVLDPTWAATQIEVPNPEAEGETMLADDPENPPRFVQVDNPECLIPADAVEVDGSTHAELIGSQAHGKIIAADENGNPVAVDPPAPSDDALAASARIMRDQMLSACDWVVTRAYEASEVVPVAWVAYRKSLRDLPSQAGFPTTINWPTAPD